MHLHMYRFLYTLLLYLLLPLVPIKLLWRGIRQPEYLRNWGERFGFFSNPPKRPLIWLHCVSVGETRAAEPLVHALMAQYPQHHILLTHGTPTGRATGKALFGATVQQVYLPYDLPFAVRRFLRHFQPDIGLIMETELWFNLIAACKKAGTPLLLANARLSEESARGYTRLGGLVREGLQNLAAVCAQTEDDANRLGLLGNIQVAVIGNLKYDVKPPENSAERGALLRDLFETGKPIFLAASTREGEERRILDAVEGLDILTVIVPRHPQRFDKVSDLIRDRGLSFQRRSQLTTTVPSHTQVILGDSLGEMFSYYAACDFTFIGGSLLKFGGQNLIEAAVMGKPILIGKFTYNFSEPSKTAVRAGAAIRVKDKDELREQILYLLHHPAKREKMQAAALQFSETSGGASKRLVQQVVMLMK